MLFLRKNFLFIFYLFSSLAISLIAHREVIFNAFNYGRHWDWSFFSFLPMYEQYIKSFYYVINNNAAGTYGAIGFSDYLVKLGLITMARLMPFASLPVINKVTVFVLFPLVSSIGMWKLTSVALRKEKDSTVTLTKFNIALFANIIYTFSLPFIYELHGGALNRMVSISIMPFIFATLYALFKAKNPVPYLLIISTLTLLLDVTNIFYILLCVCILIALKKSPVLAKLRSGLIFSVSLLLINAYWLSAIFIGRTISPIDLSSQRRSPVEVLRNYSIPFKQLLLSSGTPHNLIQTAYGNNWTIYIPSLFLFGALLYCLKKVLTERRVDHSKLIIFGICLYLMTTLLASGTYSIGNLYLALYQLPFLGFIQNSVRFSTNVILALYFLVAILISGANVGKNRLLHLSLIVGSSVWILFLALNPGFIKMTYEKSSANTPKNVRTVNNEIGSLYKSDPTLSTQLENNKFLGNVLPIPSTISPYFEHNEYPQTSQGSDTETEYEKSVLQTSGVETKYEGYLRELLRQKKYGQLLRDYSVEYIWDTHNSVYTERQHRFDHLTKQILNEMLKKDKNTLLLPLQETKSLYRTSIEYLRPIIALRTNDKSQISHLEIKKINDTEYVGVVHNPSNFFMIDFAKQYYPGWKLTFHNQPKKNISSLAIRSQYKSLPNNEYTQATVSELQTMIDHGMISTLGDGKLKKAQYHLYANGLLKNLYDITYTIDYISKPIVGTVQNENLSSNSWTTGTTFTLPNQKHLESRRFANSWKVDRAEICSHTHCDGAGDQLFFTIHFEPQYAYQQALMLSLSAFVVSALVIVRSFRPKKNEK